VKFNDVGSADRVGVGGVTTGALMTTLLEKLVLCCPPVA
jgi:hypothetical protein